MKHTKGKWEYSEYLGANEFKGMFVIHNDKCDFAYVEDYSHPYNDEEKLANAKLIASAPDLLKQNAELLEALKAIAKMTPDRSTQFTAEQAIKTFEKTIKVY